MWLLSTDRAELHEFASPEAVQGGYAILSHVWDDGEQSFQVTQTLREVCTKTGANPRDLSQPKIRFACILAESHGFEWLWVDTSCIDKSSSADLSESINSMYRYYSLANICYAYLPDVPPGPVSARSPFARSKWHTRGWTLQELIAPTFVLFLATNWTIIGTKAELADILEAITRVPAELLKMRARLVDYSVAQRMSWAASRKTKRVEDQAYCLLGIFGISMSTLYGEGEQAFYRLQEEIMKRFVDTTIFAWGSPSNLIPSNPGPVLHQLALPNNAPRPPETYLLAPNADAFKACRGITYNPPSHDYHHVPGKFRRTLHNREHSGTPTFSITPHGVLAHIPLIEDWDEYSDEVTAYLFWSSSIHRNAPLGLRLKRSPTSADPLRPHYDVVAERLVRLTWDAEGRIAIGGAPVHLSWQEIYITHRPPPESAIHEHANKLFVSLNLGYSVPFRINNKDIDNLPDSPWPMALTRCTNMPELPWDGSPPITLQLDLLDRDLELRTCFAMLSLGRCTSKRAHWACLQFTQRSVDRIISDDDDLGHDCGVDHIEAWMDRSKTFEFQPEEVGLSTTVIQGPHGPSVYRSSVTLKFNTCPLNPQNTLIMNILTTKRVVTLPSSALPLPSGPKVPPHSVIERSPSAERTQEDISGKSEQQPAQGVVALPIEDNRPFTPDSPYPYISPRRDLDHPVQDGNGRTTECPNGADSTVTRPPSQMPTGGVVKEHGPVRPSDADALQLDALQLELGQQAREVSHDHTEEDIGQREHGESSACRVSRSDSRGTIVAAAKEIDDTGEEIGLSGEGEASGGENAEIVSSERQHQLGVERPDNRGFGSEKTQLKSRTTPRSCILM